MEESEAKGGGSKKNTIIKVTVDTQQINEENIDECVVFSDDRGGPPQEPGNPKDYISFINPGMKVYWRGIAKDLKSGDSIEITDIKLKDSKGSWKLLDNVTSEEGNNGVKVGKIKDERIEDPEAYSVTFRIKGRKSEFEVDPKLQMKY